jgi:hypothetical protein
VGSYLVEIDLLRGGEHVTAVPLDWALAETGGFDYHVSVRRPARPEEHLVYPIKLPDPLPIIGIPLLLDEGEVTVNLQTLFTSAYDSARYPLQVEYDSDAVPPLTSAQAVWAKKVLADKGFGPKARSRKK